MDETTRRIGRNAEPALPRRLFYDGPLQVVLTDVGHDPGAVCGVIRAVMGVTLTDPMALYDALPLVLFRELDNAEAVAFARRLERAGATVERRVPTRKKAGITRPLSPARNAA